MWAGQSLVCRLVKVVDTDCLSLVQREFFQEQKISVYYRHAVIAAVRSATVPAEHSAYPVGSTTGRCGGYSVAH